MPLIVEHLRGEEQIQHRWSMELTLNMSTLIEEDGGPPCPHGTGYGIYAEREMVDHSFTLDYLLPDDEPSIKKGDRIRMWRGQAHG